MDETNRQSTLFDLGEYERSEVVQWGWLEPDSKLGGNDQKLPPNSPVRGQPKTLPPNLQIVTVRGRQYFLTPNKHRKQLPMETTWYEIKMQKGNPYLYLRWRSENKKKSRLLGRIDPLKYSE
jgi:hypothetical protein